MEAGKTAGQTGSRRVRSRRGGGWPASTSRHMEAPHGHSLSPRAPVKPARQPSPRGAGTVQPGVRLKSQPGLRPPHYRKFTRNATRGRARAGVQDRPHDRLTVTTRLMKMTTRRDTDDKLPPSKVKSLQKCGCGWSKISTPRGLNQHQRRMNCLGGGELRASN